MIAIGCYSCSNNNDINPDDYITSILSGKYEKSGLNKLSVTVNGEPLDDYDYVYFTTKTEQEGDFSFVNVIPGIGKRDFKDVPLIYSEAGLTFSISDKEFGISGTIIPGKMTVNITM